MKSNLISLNLIWCDHNWAQADVPALVETPGRNEVFSRFYRDSERHENLKRFFYKNELIAKKNGPIFGKRTI